MLKRAVLGAMALLAGCATTSPTDDGAAAQCQYFVRAQGLEWISNVKSEPATDGTAVTMRVRDALGRDFQPTCIYAAGKPARWAAPLPSNVVTRQTGRDTIAPPPK